MNPLTLPGRLIVLLIALGFISACSNEAAPTPEADTPRLVEATRVQAASGSSPISLSGRVRAVERTVLSFEVSGEIADIYVDVGDAIAQGQVLARLDDQRYRLVLNQARAAVAEARASLTEKQRDFDRLQQLQGKGFVSQASLDAARAALTTARSRLNSARAALEIAERDVALTQLRSPFTGSISERLAQPSQRVAPNEPVLAAISERGGFEVYTHVPEALVSKLELGSEHQVLIPALGTRRLSATIEHIGTQPASSNNYPLVLALHETDLALRAGMTAQVRLTPHSAPAKPDALLVPLTSLVHGADQQIHVLRIGDANVLKAVPVSVIEARAQSAKVQGALQVGDRIVARGAEFVAPGETVAILGEGPQRFN